MLAQTSIPQCTIPQCIKNLPLKKQMALAFGCGSFSILSMAPLFWWPILFLTLTPMLWMIDGAVFNVKTQQNNSFNRKISSAAAIGWAFGFGYFFFSLYWLGSSFLIEADKFAWALPFAITILPAALAVFYGLAMALCTVVWPNGPSRLFVFAVLFMAIDAVRSNIFTGLPWNLIGHGLTGNLYLMQSVSLFGIYGLSAVAILIFASPACLYDQQGNEFNKKSTRWQSRAPVIAAVIMLIGLHGFGFWRLATFGKTTFQPNLELVIIQPNIPQIDKVDPTKGIGSLEKILDLTTKALQQNQQPKTTSQKRLIIWPETAIPFALQEEATITDRLARLLHENDQLITGAYHIERDPAQTKNTDNTKVYNSLFIVNGNGKITSRYDKNHLVPFGEYLPFPGLLSAIGFEALVRMRGGFTKGKVPIPLHLKNAPSFLPFICYEAIFPLANNIRKSGVKWLLNISNDGWFGGTTGPYQHAHMVRMRSLETGLPTVRVVNGGISAIYDGLGQIVASTPLGVKTTLTAKLPRPVLSIYPPFKEYLLLLGLFVASNILISTMKFFDKSGQIE